MYHWKHLEAASLRGPRPKLTFVAALLGFLSSFSKPDGVGLSLGKSTRWGGNEGLLLMAIPVLP